MTDTIPERVGRGVPFLDEHDPGWWRADVDRAINLSTLNMVNGEACVLGQRCPLDVLQNYASILQLYPQAEDRYYAYAAKLALLSDRDRREWSDEHGFTLPQENGTSWGGWHELTAEWRRVITERRAAA
jgi:hypothetical protein